MTFNRPKGPGQKITVEYEGKIPPSEDQKAAAIKQLYLKGLINDPREVVYSSSRNKSAADNTGINLVLKAVHDPKKVIRMQTRSSSSKREVAVKVG
jgi:hypothetical protein